LTPRLSCALLDRGQTSGTEEDYMTRAVFRRYFQELGWKRTLGGTTLSMEFPDRIITLIPQIWRTSLGPAEVKIDLNPGLSTRRFSAYCTTILQPKDRTFYSFFRPRPPMRMFVDEISMNIAFDASAKVLSWAKPLNLATCLRTNLSYPKEAAPLFTVYRMIALKLEGRGAELDEIITDLRTWSRQGYDPNITEAHVQRAIDLDVSAGL
jgi:hypothetical protein